MPFWSMVRLGVVTLGTEAFSTSSERVFELFSEGCSTTRRSFVPGVLPGLFVF